jgi:hypothetical protein
MQPSIPDSPDEQPASGGSDVKGVLHVDGLTQPLTCDMVFPTPIIVVLSAAAVAGLAAQNKRRRGRSIGRPQVLSCATADDGMAVPDPKSKSKQTPESTPEPESVPAPEPVTESAVVPESTPTPQPEPAPESTVVAEPTPEPESTVVPEPESEPESVPVESDAMAQFYTSEGFLDAALDTERVVARMHAQRARNLAAARRHGERAVMLSEGQRSPDAATTRWSTSEIAYRGFVPQVACKLHISEGAAETLITTSTTLVDTFPTTLAVLENGDMPYRNAETLVRHSYRVPDKHQHEYETTLIPFAQRMTPAAFDNKARRVADSYLADPLQQRHEEAMERRQVTVEACPDGMAELRLYGDAIDIYAAYHRLTDIGRSLLHPADGRTLTQLRLDAATTLLLTGECDTPGTDLAGAVHGFDPTAVGKGKKKNRKGLGVGIRPTVSILVPVLSILGHSDEPATLEGYGPIDPQRARELMGRDGTSFTRILTDPETGAILSVGTTKYTVPAAMRMFLLTRDVRCRFPGCTTPARSCELDHTQDWQYGGPTDVLNLACLCKKHHDLKHNTAWSYTQKEFGVITWVTPTGETYITEPENWIQGQPATPTPTPTPTTGTATATATATIDATAGTSAGEGQDITTPWDLTYDDAEIPPERLPF